MNLSLLPNEIVHIIQKNVYQIMLRDSLNIIKKIGISEFEDLPDLEYHANLYYHRYNIEIESAGWSKRVTDFLQHNNSTSNVI